MGRTSLRRRKDGGTRLWRKALQTSLFPLPARSREVFKSFLFDKEGKFPKVHSLLELLGLASYLDQNLNALRNDCLYLDQFYVPTRYPDAPLGNLAQGSPDQDDAKKAMDSFKQIEDTITRKLS
jgi:HEPN domain-containing protein